MRTVSCEPSIGCDSKDRSRNCMWICLPYIEKFDFIYNNFWNNYPIMSIPFFDRTVHKVIQIGCFLQWFTQNATNECDNFPDTVIIGSSAVYPLAKDAIQMLIVVLLLLLLGLLCLWWKPLIAIPKAQKAPERQAYICISWQSETPSQQIVPFLSFLANG